MFDFSMRHIVKSLAGKLIIALGLLIFTGGGISWYLLIDAGRTKLMKNALEYAMSFSDLVKRSTRYSMLTYHREAIQQTIEEIGSRKGIEGVRIFDKKGRIFYSVSHAEVGQTVDRRARVCTGCHNGGGRPLESIKDGERWVIHSGGAERILTLVDPIYNEPSCSLAACHAHPQVQKVLGVLEMNFSLEPVDRTIRKQTFEMSVYALLFMAVSALALYLVLRRLVLRPVSGLSKAMERVAAGDFTQTLAITSQDEIGRLAAIFNLMTKDLESARQKVDNWTQTLEEEIAKKTDELRRSQDKLIQAEKLASLGRLTSDVAHEIRNPLTALGGFAHRLSRIAAGGKEKEYADIVVTEVTRLEKILRDVLTFSRDARCHVEKHRIDDVLRDALKVFLEMCREQSIKVTVKTDEELPEVMIDADQVRQALSNLITNAVDAMPEGGTLTVSTSGENIHDTTYVCVKVSDTGGGIAEGKLPLIFEPFFSTKEVGHGTGLGLSITGKIMEEHGGFVRAESIPGEGSTFSLCFPWQSDRESLKVKCWEYMKCGRDRDATEKCPAYPNYGRVCWAVAGSFCTGRVQGTFAQKYEDCKKCEFYRRLHNKEI